jgi:hypothetical protein
MKRIKDLNTKFNIHKRTHSTLTVNIIEDIIRDFILIRDELRETISFDDEVTYCKPEPYIPTDKRKRMAPKRRLF